MTRRDRAIHGTLEFATLPARPVPDYPQRFQSHDTVNFIEKEGIAFTVDACGVHPTAGGKFAETGLRVLSCSRGAANGL